MSENLKDIVNKLGKARDMIAMLESPYGDSFSNKETQKKVKEENGWILMSCFRKGSSVVFE